MRLNVFCDPFNSSGFAQHARGMARAMNKQVDTSIEAFSPATQEYADLVPLMQKGYSDATTVMISNPGAWQLKQSERVPLIPFGVFEGTRTPTAWRKFVNHELNQFLAVPSTHCAQAFAAGGCEIPIEVIPEGVDTDLYKPLNVPHDKFRFVFSGGWARGVNDRKGLQFLLKAFTDEFGKDENVELIAKINPVYNPMLNIPAEIEKLNLRSNSVRPDVQILNSISSEKEMVKLYQSCDCFVVPSMAEGFGLNYLEAMAVGKPCIATNFGGHTDFITKDNGWLVDYQLTYPTSPELWYEEAEWALPSQDGLRAALREAFSSPELTKKKGDAALSVAKNLTWDSAATKLIDKAVGFMR